MVAKIISFILKLLPSTRKNTLVKFIYTHKPKSYNEILLLIDAENVAYRAAFSILLENEDKQQQLVKFFGSKASEEPKAIYEFMDEFSKDFMVEIASRHCIMMYAMKIDFALLDYSQYRNLMSHISLQKEALADHMNDVINSKLESLNKEITQAAWEEHIAEQVFLPVEEPDDDLWN